MLDQLKQNSRAWAEGKLAVDPASSSDWRDNRVPNICGSAAPTAGYPRIEIVGLDPGELFVRRNAANLAPPQDANYLSVLQFAIDVLKVKHVLVVCRAGKKKPRR